MSTLPYIDVAGLAMRALALVGAVSLVLPKVALDRILLPLVGAAAGSLLGGAFFHMLPKAVRVLGDGLPVYLWTVAGFLVFFVVGQFLHWHHCHRSDHTEHRPLGHLVLVADGLHDVIGGLAIGGAFTVDVGVGRSTRCP